MKNLKTLIALCFVILCNLDSIAQNNIALNGRVISEDFELLQGARIYKKDTTFLGTVGESGYFEIEISAVTDELLVRFIGMEQMTFKIIDISKPLEIIVLSDIIYDFIPFEKANRKRKERFNLLPKKHKEAYKKGIFKAKHPNIKYIYN